MVMGTSNTKSRITQKTKKLCELVGSCYLCPCELSIELLGLSSSQKQEKTYYCGDGYPVAIVMVSYLLNKFSECHC